jgi:hypothetical protein
MNSFLDIALNCAARGWYVFPCSGKVPLHKGGYQNASKAEGDVQKWWAKTPDANVAIAPGLSGLTILDIDHGIRDESHLREFLSAHDIPVTFAVRTGRRPEFAVQLYYSEPIPSVGGWQIGDCQGDVRGVKGHVMAAGSIHPDSKERYEVLWDLPIVPVPNFVRALRSAAKERDGDSTAPITEWRNDTLYRVLCKHRANGADDEMIRDFALREVARMPNPLMEEETEQIIRNACKQPKGQPEAVAVIGEMEKKPVTHWRERYATFEQLRDAKPTSFLIEGFLALDSITALAAPVGQRKSLIALNVAHSLCTGEPLFDYFKVVKQPERVVYLCPEMGLSSFSTRLKQIGLLEHVGKNLFCRTMDDTNLKLSELDGELPGSVVILDTLTRFVDGDQNSSEDMARFAQEVFRVKRQGATVLLLHHSVKGTGNSVALTLDSAMRGSTELAAFVTSCWATRLIDANEPYQSPSLLVNVKQRDYESKPFEATCGADCRMRIVGEPGQLAELKDAKDAEAEKVLAALLERDPKMSIHNLRSALADAGFRKGVQWVTKARGRILGTGVTVSAA